MYHLTTMQSIADRRMDRQTDDIVTPTANLTANLQHNWLKIKEANG